MAHPQPQQDSLLPRNEVPDGILVGELWRRIKAPSSAWSLATSSNYSTTFMAFSKTMTRSTIFSSKCICSSITPCRPSSEMFPSRDGSFKWLAIATWMSCARGTGNPKSLFPPSSARTKGRDCHRSKLSPIASLCRRSWPRAGSSRICCARLWFPCPHSCLRSCSCAVFHRDAGAYPGPDHHACLRWHAV